MGCGSNGGLRSAGEIHATSAMGRSSADPKKTASAPSTAGDGSGSSPPALCNTRNCGGGPSSHAKNPADSTEQWPGKRERYSRWCDGSCNALQRGPGKAKRIQSSRVVRKLDVNI